MDQAQLNTLDPKLREAYQRIMGTPVKPPTPVDMTVPPSAPPVANVTLPTPPPTVATPASAQPSINPQSTTVTPATQMPQENHHAPSQPIPASGASNTFNQASADTVARTYIANEVSGAKQSIHMIQVMFVVGGLFFFIAYALFWMKLFNVSTPF